MSKLRRRIMMAVLAALGVYAGLCGAARVLYPRVLFPAPRIDGTPLLDDPDAKLVRLGATEGIHWAAPSADARTIVMFHGNGETIFHIVEMGAELHRRGLGVLLVEYRGYGRLHGEPPTEAMLYEDAAAGIAWLASEAGGKVDDAHLSVFGWSLGSSVAAEMAFRGHGSRLFLVCPFTSIVAMGKRFAPFLPIGTIMSHRLDTLSKAPSIKQDTTVIHGDADELIPFAMGAEVAAAIPSAKLVKILRGHHADMFWPGSGASPDAAALFDLVSAR